MAKREKTSPKLVIEEAEFPTLAGDQNFTEIKRTKGTVQFTSLHFPPNVGVVKKIKNDNVLKRPHLKWQGYTELTEDHGFSLSYDVIFASAPEHSGIRNTAKLPLEIAESIGESAWARIEEYLSTLDDDSGHRDIFIRAAWAQLFAEPYEELWLAAMAQHAYYILEDDYAFGYLTALLDQKRNNEEHFMRGRKSVESAQLGGQTRAKQQSLKTAQTLHEMARLAESGQTIARAATLAFKNGFGSSEAANKRLWTRHSK